MTNLEIQSALEALTGWKVVEVNQVRQLRKTYRFNHFAEALAFTNRVGALAEQKNHHPQIITEWGKVTLAWWTHTAKGLTENDFTMAKLVDEL